MRFLARPKGFAKPRPRNAPPGRFCPAGRKARGTGCSNPPLLLLHKIHAKQKEQRPIRRCSWCDREDSNLWPSGSEYYGQEATVTLLDAKDEGVQTFEQAKDSLKVFYARQKLRNTENDSVKSR